jgi:hypothetical protein
VTAIPALGALVGAVSLSRWARTLPAVIAGGVMGELGVSESGLAAATAMGISASRSARCRPVWTTTGSGRG